MAKLPPEVHLLGVTIRHHVSLQTVIDLIHALDKAHPLEKGNGKELARVLRAQGVEPKIVQRAHTAMGQLPRRSHQRLEIAHQIRPHRERLWNAFLELLPSRERSKYEISSTPISSARFHRRAAPKKFTPGDDRKF